MNIRQRTVTTLSIVLTIGFFTGIVAYLRHIITNRYIQYEMHRLLIVNLQEYLNRFVLYGMLAWAVVMILFVVTELVCRRIVGGTQKSGRLKIIRISVILLGLCGYAVWYIHYYYVFFSPTRFHLKTFLYDTVIIGIAMIAGWCLYKVNWNRLLVSIKARHINKAAVILVLLLGVFNVSLLVYTKTFTIKKPDIIFISIDTLRADHLGCYGYGRNTSPNIDAFAKENILFEKCYVHEPWTLASHMSMFTSLYPITHGVGRTFTAALPARVVTLAEILKNDGYATMGFVTGGLWMHPAYGFYQGFDYYHLEEKYNPEEPLRNGEYQNLFIEKYLQKNKKKNNFIFIHYFDVHSDTNELPYDAPPPYDTLFTKNYTGDVTGVHGNIAATKFLGYIEKNKIAVNGEDLDYIISLYDNGIAYMDKCIGDLFKMLRAMDLYENSLIILTSDHGEAFLEHGYMTHGKPYYHEEQMHVPLIIKLPQGGFSFTKYSGEKTISHLVESIDIMPFILDIVGAQKPFLQGESFIELLQGGKEGKEYAFGFGTQEGLFIRSERWKMINDKQVEEDRFKLFDLQADPGEQTDLVAQEPDVKATLHQELLSKLEALQDVTDLVGVKEPGITTPFEKKVHIGQEEREKLKALGYLE